jgi:hypothetical protein
MKVKFESVTLLLVPCTVAHYNRCYADRNLCALSLPALMYPFFFASRWCSANFAFSLSITFCRFALFSTFFAFLFLTLSLRMVRACCIMVYIFRSWGSITTARFVMYDLLLLARFTLFLDLYGKLPSNFFGIRNGLNTLRSRTTGLYNESLLMAALPPSSYRIRPTVRIPSHAAPSPVRRDKIGL